MHDPTPEERSLTFEERLQQHVRDQRGDGIDWDRRRDAWQTRVGALMSDIKTWLAPAIKAGLLLVDLSEESIAEEFIGNYSIPRLTIWAGDQQVSIRPRGTLILGSHGRVDIQGPRSKAMLILEYPGDTSVPSWKRVEEAKWYVWDSDTRRQLQGLSEESFKSIIMDALGI